MLERLLHGGLRSQGMPADALALATLETGVALYALDAATGAGRRSGSRRGERLALADAAGPIAPLFSPPGAGPRARAAARARCSSSRSSRRRCPRCSSRRRCGRRPRRSLQLTPRHEPPPRDPRRPPPARRARRAGRRAGRVQTLKYKYGPIKITPGQNTIEFEANELKPQVPGYITRFEPDLVRRGRHDPGRRRHPPAPRRLDHARPRRPSPPARRRPSSSSRRLRLPLRPERRLDHEPHAPQPGAVERRGVHHLRHRLPPGDARGAGHDRGQALWMDVAGISPTRSSTSSAAAGANGKYTFPNHARGRPRIGAAHRWTADKDITLVGTGGHLHPGGLYTDLFARRAGQDDAPLPLGGEVLRARGRRVVGRLHDGHQARLEDRVQGRRAPHVGTYDTAQGVLVRVDGHQPGLYARGHGRHRPVRGRVDTRACSRTATSPRTTTTAARRLAACPTRATLLTGARSTRGRHRGFMYGRGDLSLTGRAAARRPSGAASR